MKPQPKNRKVELTFMDVSVKIESNGKNIESKALTLLSAMIHDKIKIFELMQELDHEDEIAEIKHKKPKIKINEYLRGYT